ncbi:hypothetical protein RJ641_025948 [Dillenia turbinata]|uniref:Uncharacterized protein n=1 Tax=Dillenia turbinata TaxID=194707 RepID=A0AAN8WBG4_9MAGN
MIGITWKIENHGIDKEMMEKVKQLANMHYEEKMKNRFYDSDLAKGLEKKSLTSSADWESAFFICHRPTSNIHDFTDLSDKLR